MEMLVPFEEVYAILRNIWHLVFICNEDKTMAFKGPESGLIEVCSDVYLKAYTGGMR